MKKRIAFLLVAIFCVAALAACGKQPTGTQGASGDELKNAVSYLKTMYKDKPAEKTPSDYELTSVVAVNGVQYKVTWTTDNAEVKVIEGTNKVTIDVNEESPSEVKYVLTATVADANGKTEKLTFNHIVPAYELTTWSKYIEAEVGANVVCKGIVTGIMSKKNGNGYNCLYFQDNDGGYYAYGMASDPVEDGIKVGMTVKVAGTKDVYSGTHEIKDGVATIIDQNSSVPAAVDYTDIFKNAADIKDAKLVEKQALLVTIKGVEIAGQETASGYLYFKLAGKESYTRISSSVCPIVADKDGFISAHGEHTGWVANVTGVICVYDGAFYLTPVTKNDIEYVSLPTKTDKEMAEFEAENLTIPARVTEAGTVDLSAKGATYDSVKIEWATNNDAVAAIADGKLTFVLPAKDTEVVVTATLTSGSEKVTKEFAIKVEAPADDLSVAETLKRAFELAEGEAMTGVQVLRGEIVEIPTAYNEQYDNVTVNIKIGEQVIQCFRLIGGKDLKVGDVITVTGNIKNYKGTVEFDAKCTYSATLSVEEAKQLAVVAKAFELAEGEAMTGTQVLKGEIVEIPTAYNEQYDNITVNIKVGEQTIQCFRLIGGKELKVGDNITVTGNIKNYKGTVEFDAKCTFVKDQSLEDAKAALVVAKAFALAEGEAMTTLETLTGEIVEIPTAYNEQYDNITVNIKIGEQIIQCFRLIGGKELKVGDVITVTGIIKNYKGTVEFDAKCTFTK